MTKIAKNQQVRKKTNILKEIYPSVLLIAIFLLLFFVLAYSYLNIFYPLKYSTRINNLCSQYDIEPAVVASMINAESGFDKNCVSKKGAVGLMQLMPSTANFIASHADIKLGESIDLTDVDTNLSLGIAYIKYLNNKFPDVFTMLCAYNAGEGNVYLWLRDSRYSRDGVKLLTTPYKETNAYAKKVMRNIPYYEKRIN